MSIFEWYESIYHRYRAKRTINSLKALPQLHTVDELPQWVNWLNRHRSQITFNIYSPRLAHQIECRTKCNNVEELIESLSILNNSIENGKSIRYPEIPTEINKESNLDYFLTDKHHRPLDIKTVYKRITHEVNRLVVSIGKITDDSSTKTYYHSKANQILDDLSMVLIAIIISSDLIGYKTIGANR